MNLPDNIIINTGIDTLSHLLEGYFSNDVTPISDIDALEGLRYFKK